MIVSNNKKKISKMQVPLWFWFELVIKGIVLNHHLFTRVCKACRFSYPFVWSSKLKRLSWCWWNDTRLFFIRMYFIGTLKVKVADNIRMFRGSNSNQHKNFYLLCIVKMHDLKVRKSIQRGVKEILESSIHHHLR